MPSRSAAWGVERNIVADSMSFSFSARPRTIPGHTHGNPTVNSTGGGASFCNFRKRPPPVSPGAVPDLPLPLPPGHQVPIAALHQETGLLVPPAHARAHPAFRVPLGHYALRAVEFHRGLAPGLPVPPAARSPASARTRTQASAPARSPLRIRVRHAQAPTACAPAPPANGFQS